MQVWILEAVNKGLRTQGIHKTFTDFDMLIFVKTIYFISYIYAIGITLIFTIIVNIVTYFALKKIDMIESLKSVE